MPPIIIYLTGFHQHAGKTVASIGIIARLRKIMDPARIGFFKPVGQELVTLPNGNKIDKDAMIIKKFSRIADLDLDYISPVRLGSGFTKQFLDLPNQHDETLKLRAAIMKSIESMQHKDIIIAEGTGHPGVGNIVGLSNAKVSNIMKADIIFLSGGGIGKALDMLEVDLSYFLYKKSRVKGIIFNKIIPQKIDTVKKYITEKLINDKFGAIGAPIKILGFLPQIEELSNPSLNFIFHRWPEAIPLGETEDFAWKRPCNQIKIMSMPFIDLKRTNFLNPGNLIVMSSLHQKRVRSVLKYNKTLIQHSAGGLGGLILTGGLFVDLDARVKEDILASELPAMYVPEHTAACGQKLLHLFDNTKLQVYDTAKILEIEALFEKYFDMDKFIEVTGIRP